MRKMILAIETSSMRREVISAMVNNILVEVYNSSGIEQICQEEREKGEGWTEKAEKGRQVDLKMGALRH